MMGRKRKPSCSASGESALIPGKIAISSSWGDYTCSLFGVPALVCQSDNDYVLDGKTSNFIQKLTIFLSEKHPEINCLDTANLWVNIDTPDLQEELIRELYQEKIVIVKKDDESYYIPDFLVRRIPALQTSNSEH